MKLKINMLNLVSRPILFKYTTITNPVNQKLNSRAFNINIKTTTEKKIEEKYTENK